MSDLLSVLTSRGFMPRKVSVKDGGEYASPCPVCGDGGKGGKSDRFHIWPDKDSGGLSRGRFWCRQCGISGDTIALVQQVDGVSFPEACGQLGIILPKTDNLNSRRYQPAPSLPQQQGEWRPTVYPEPDRRWQEKAANFLDDCHERLLNDKVALQWLADRGLDQGAVHRFRLGYNQSSKGKDRYRPRRAWGLPEKTLNGKDKKLWLPRGWVVPAYNGSGDLVHLRIRRLDEDIAAFGGHIKYLPVDGSSMATMVLHQDAEVFVVVEGGFDALLLACTLGGKIGVITSWNSSARPDARTHKLLQRSSLVLGGLDYDQGGDREQDWWHGTYRQYSRLPALPGGAKDPGDAFAAGVDLYEWVLSGIPRGLKLKLGYLAKTKPAANITAGQEQNEEQRQDDPEQETAGQEHEVAEISLTNGKTIYVADDRQTWAELAAEGKPVFSRNEIARLHAATATMDGEERLAAAMQAIEVKEVFGGYIRAGRTVQE